MTTIRQPMYDTHTGMLIHLARTAAFFYIERQAIYKKTKSPIDKKVVGIARRNSKEALCNVIEFLDAKSKTLGYEQTRTVQWRYWILKMHRLAKQGEKA